MYRLLYLLYQRKILVILLFLACISRSIVILFLNKGYAGLVDSILTGSYDMIANSTIMLLCTGVIQVAVIASQNYISSVLSEKIGYTLRIKAIYGFLNAEYNVCFFVLFIAGTFTYNCIFWCLYSSSSARISGKIRWIIFSRLCTLRMSDIENHHSADTLSILTNDLNAAQGIYENIRLYLYTLMSGIVPSILVFNTSGVLGLLIVILGIMQLLVNLLVIKPLEKQSVRVREDMIMICCRHKENSVVHGL